LVAASATMFGLAGCATIVHGTSQDIKFSSTPTGASVWVDETDKGQTPLVTKLTRKQDHVIKIQMDGYQPFETTVTHSMSGWAWGNLLFGGLIGIAIDAISGGVYKLTPEEVAGSLPTRNASIDKNKDGIYVVVVLQPKPEWVKVAQLQR